MRHILTLCLLGLVILCNAKDGLIFEAGFDQYTANATVSQGNRKARGLEENDLQLRMYKGVNNQGNGILLNSSEYCQWDMEKHLDPRQGTVSFWLKNVDWKLDGPEWQVFFVAQRQDFDLCIWRVWPSYINLVLYLNGDRSKGYTLGARLNPDEWNGKKWHKIDFTWDLKEYKLYVDGCLPPKTPTYIGNKSVAPTTPVKSFPEGLRFPQPGKGGSITLGVAPSKRYKHVSKTSNVAYHKLKIYNRPLSAQEIRQSFEALLPAAPSTQQLPNRLIVPRQRGVVVPLMEKLRQDEQDLPVSAMVWHDQSHLWIEFNAQIPLGKHVHQQQDGKLWEDDSFEFHLGNSKGDRHQFIINGFGAIYDARNLDQNWTSGAAGTVSKSPKGWTAILKIPKITLGDLTGELPCNFCFAKQGQTQPFYRLWTCLNRGGFAPDGRLVLSNQKEAFHCQLRSDLCSGTVDLKRKGPGNVSIAVCSEDGTSFTLNERTDQSWFKRLQAGKYTLVIEEATAQGPGFRYRHDFYVRPPMEITHHANPLTKTLRIEFNFNNSPAAVRDEIAKGISAQIALKRPDGSVCSSAKGLLNRVRGAELTMPLPDKLAQGTYQIHAQASGTFGTYSHTLDLRIPDLRPYTAKLGKDHTVPPPWTPVVRKSDHSFQILDRQYDFDPCSPFPRQMTTRGVKTLLKPPQMLLNGIPIRWSPWTLTASHPDVIMLTGQGEGTDVQLQWRGELWFDGMYLLNLSVIPKNELAISNLAIDMTAAAEICRFAMNPLYVPWQDSKVEVALGPQGRKDNLLWLSNHETGLLAWVESNANWVNHPGEKPIRAVKNSDGSAVMSLNMITRKAILTKRADYRLVFMATPSRRPTVPARTVNYNGYNIVRNNGYQSICWGNFEKKPYTDDCTSLNSLKPADEKAWKSHAYLNKKGKKGHLYSMPGHICNQEADVDYLGTDLRSVPELSYVGTKNGVPQITYQYCTRASELPADLWCWNYAENRKRFRGYDYDGIYFDIGATRFCHSLRHGCAGKDAFGQDYISSDALGMRRFMMRVYKVVHADGGTIMLHAHVQFIPFTHGFCDMFSPGENTFSAIAKNLKFGYLEDISPEVYQTDFNWRKAGVAYQIIPQTARVCMIIPSLKKHLRHVMNDISYANAAIAAFAAHDLNLWATGYAKAVDEYWQIRKDCHLEKAEDFHGYWNQKHVSSGSSLVRCGYFSWKTPQPYSHVLVLSNFNRQATPLKLRLDTAGLRLATPTYKNLRTGATLSHKELMDLVIPGADYLLIGIVPK